MNGFEKDLEEFVNGLTPNPSPKGEGNLHKRVVALSAGTAAVHLGLLAAGVKAGDEVIVLMCECLVVRMRYEGWKKWRFEKK